MQTGDIIWVVRILPHQKGVVEGKVIVSGPKETYYLNLIGKNTEFALTKDCYKTLQEANLQLSKS